MNMRTLSTMALLAVAAVASAQSETFAPKRITAYPFVAAKERADFINANFGKVTPGMTAAKVRSVLGEPDEVRPLYEPRVTDAKQIGHTFWYVIRRAQEHGSANDRNESAVRVSFDLNGKVTKVAHW